jgi:hypothetical protein
VRVVFTAKYCNSKFLLLGNRAEGVNAILLLWLKCTSGTRHIDILVTHFCTFSNLAIAGDEGMEKAS